MNTTSASLLDRLKEPAPGEADWRRLHDLYGPLIRAWLARCVDPAGEADDLAQEVLLVVVREVPDFQRQRHGSFRAWLRGITVNRVRTWRRARHRGPDPADRFLDDLADPASDLSRQWDRDHDRHVFDRLLALVQPDCEPATWEAFRLFAIEGRPAAAVAATTGLTENAVLLAKSRILKRLRAEAAGLID